MSLQEIISILFSDLKKLIMFSGMVVILTFLILLLVFPIKYVSQVSLLPPENDNAGGLASLVGGMDAGALIGVTPGEEQAQLYTEILKSRTVAKYVIDNSELLSYYDEEDWRRAVVELQSDIAVEATKESMIILKYQASTPLFSRFTELPDSINKLSAKIANLYIEALDSINTAKLNIKAKNTRLYIEKQIMDTEQKLVAAQTNLLEFQKRNKTISLPEQIVAAINNAADVKAKIIAGEIELKKMELNINKSSKTYKDQRKLNEVLDRQYDELVSGNGADADYLPAFDNIPDIQIELAEITRNVRIQNEVYLFLKRQYHKEKILENKNVPTVEVLDKAIPHYKSKSPRLVFHSALSGVVAFCFMGLILVLKEYKKKELREKSKEI